MVCGETVTEVNSWEGGDSLRDLSAGLGFINEQMSVLEPPTEVAEWHHAQIAFAGVFKETVDDFLEDPGDQTEDDFILSMFFTVAPHFEPVDEGHRQAMDPEVRARMTDAGCIYDGTTQGRKSYHGVRIDQRWRKSHVRRGNRWLRGLLGRGLEWQHPAAR